MMMIWWISMLLTVFYACLMLWYWYQWSNHSDVTSNAPREQPMASVIIPVRNEAANIGTLLQDLLLQNYPKEKLEILVIDDHSDDETANIVRSFADPRVKLICLQEWLRERSLSKAYKKRAIEAGVQSAQGSIILTTDGDCRVQPNWINSMLAAKEQSGAKLVTGPVVFEGDRTRFEQFQALDFLGMMGITAASLKGGFYNMANGANMLYEKAIFLELDGYKGIDHTASGDDMLLVYKIAKAYDGAVTFAKSRSAVVRTAPMHTLRDFLQQRFRWTSKSGQYQDKRITLILGLVYLFVLSLFLNLLIGLHSPILLGIGLLQLIVKSMVDIPLLFSTSSFFGRSDLMRSYISSQLLHIWYIVFVGTLGNILSYEWKGRTLKDK